MSKYECEDCGEGFDTLSSKRLHDCPAEPIESGEKVVEEIAGRRLHLSDMDELEDRAGVERAVPVLAAEGIVLSFVIELEESCHGIHSDHETSEWHTTVSGSDFDDVMAEHEEWLDEDMDRVHDEMGVEFF